jgi:thioredoxin 1
MNPLRAYGIHRVIGLALVAMLSLLPGCGPKAGSEDDGLLPTLTEATFVHEVEESKGLVVVDFWASWCGPCRLIAPMVHELAEEFEGRVRFCKVDVDRDPNLAQNYGITAIPCLVLFRDGRGEDRRTGVYSKKDYRQWLEEWLAKAEPSQVDGTEQTDDAERP